MNFPIETAQRIMAELSQPVYPNGDLNRSYRRSVEDLINIIYKMDVEMSALKQKLETVESTKNHNSCRACGSPDCLGYYCEPCSKLIILSKNANL